MEQEFTNGFDSWLETFFQLSTMIQHDYDANWNNSDIITQVKLTQDAHGHFGLCDLAKEWTNEFEKQFEGEDWADATWFDEIEAFFELKNKA